MGYRSDVRIVVSRNGYKQFKKYVEEHINKYKLNLSPDSISAISNYDYNLLNSLDVSKISPDKKEVYFGWDSLKWYDGYEEVDAIMDNLNRLEENGYGYGYARLGEDVEDYEELYSESSTKDGIEDIYVPSISRYFSDDDLYYDCDLKKEFMDKNKDKER